jgi:hypothetical protein
MQISPNIPTDQTPTPDRWRKLLGRTTVRPYFHKASTYTMNRLGYLESIGSTGHRAAGLQKCAKVIQLTKLAASFKLAASLTTPSPLWGEG